MRGTPASRSSSASGSGLWWNEVRIAASSTARRASSSSSRCVAPFSNAARIGVDPLGAVDEDVVDARQQHRRLQAARPAQQREALGVALGGADRRAGEQHVAVVVEAGDEDVRHGSTIRIAVCRSGATSGAAATSSGRVRGVGTSTAWAPAARAASNVGADVADHDAALGPHAEPCGRLVHEPGRGLAAVAAVLGGVRAEQPRVERAEQRVGLRVDGAHLRLRQQPASDAALVADDGGGDVLVTQALQRLARTRHRLDLRRVAVVGDVDDQGVVAVEEDGGGLPRQPPRARARRAGAGRWLRRASPRSSATIVAISLDVRGPATIRLAASSAVPRGPGGAGCYRGSLCADGRGYEGEDGGRGGQCVAWEAACSVLRRARASRLRGWLASARRRRCRPASSG